MINICKIFAREVRLLGANVITAVIVLGLILMPSLFTWYNVLACWDVFDNSGNLTVAVANCDDGYTSDLLPLEVNVGDQVVSALRENTDFGWVFVSEDEAIDGAASGKYYAAVVIPEGFSERMLTFYEADGDDESAELVYYSNEKKNAIAPKITGKGADAISYQVNEAFVETISEIALSIASSLNTYLDKSDASGKIGVLADDLDLVSGRVSQASRVLSLYGGLAQSSQTLLSGTSKLVGDANTSAQDILDIAQGAADNGQVTVDELQSSLDGMSTALNQSIASIEKILEQERTYIDTDIEKAIADLENEKSSIQGQIDGFNELLTELQKDPEGNRVAIAATERVIEHLTTLQDAIQSSIDELKEGKIAHDWADIKEKAQEAKASLEELKSLYENEIRTSLSELSSEIAGLSASVNALSGKVSSATSGLNESIGSAEEGMTKVDSKLASVAADMDSMATKISTLATDLKAALASNDLESVRSLLSSGVDTLSAALSAPVSVERNAVFPSSSFGSSMLPLYASIALFVGALLLLVLFQPMVSPRVMESFPEDKKPSRREQFLGHFGVLSVVSLLQTTVLGLGCIFFLNAQVAHPLLFMICFWVSGLVFTVIMYSVVFSFSNVGKAVGVILLVIQVTGSGGSYPLSILPDFVQRLSSFLPAYHIVNAMRAAMFGVYQGDFFIEMLVVVLFAIPFILLVLIFAHPFKLFYDFYIKRANESKLLS